MERNSKSCIEIRNEYANTGWVENCNGECHCLKNGRQKQNNIMLVGPINCGKSFLLGPLELICKTFMNPSATSYAWVGLKECKLAISMIFVTLHQNA